MAQARPKLSILVLSLLWALYAGLAINGLELPVALVAPFVSALAALYVYKAGRASAQYPVRWFLIALGLCLWALADGLSALDLLFLQTNPARNTFLLYFYALPNLCILLSVFQLIVSERRPLTSIQLLLDCLAIFTGLAGFIYYAFFNNRFQAMLQFDHQSITAFVYLILDMLIITFGTYVYASVHNHKLPVFFTIEFCGIMLFALSDVVYVYAVFSGAFPPQAWLAGLALLANAIIGIGAVFYRATPTNVFKIRKIGFLPTGAMPSSLVLIIIPVIASFFRRMHLQEILFFAGIIMLHQTLSLITRHLLRRERELTQRSEQAEYLEATIADRTRELRIMNQTLENLLKRDATTGQFNRKYFMEVTEEWINGAEGDEKVWMMILDFDRFKTINDTYGHDVGDQVLRLIGKRLEAFQNERTVFGRLGGDEFGIVCRRTAQESMRPLLQTIADMSKRPLQVSGFTVHVGISIGVACWPDDAHSRSDLMRHADIAMYIAKKERSAGFSFFDVSVNAGIERVHQIDLALKKASIEEEFSLVYQPQVAIGGRRLVGMEALVRWDSPELGTVTPDEFIPVAEENGVILPLSDWILRHALARIADWNSRYRKNLVIGINVSPQQLDDPDFILKLIAAMDDHQVRPEWVNIEITERSAMKDESFIIEVFNQLSSLNVASSIDDFGTGYSSLSYLKTFNIDYLKIAKQLVDFIATDETDVQIVQAIIMMATAMNLRTIAEGVETEKQLRILESLGCDEIQGYYFGKPQPPEEFEELFLKE